MSVNLFHWISLPSHNDGRGGLVAIESTKTVPFEIKRIYYVHGVVPGVPRGFHAHRALEQVAVCVSGKCRIVLDDGSTRASAWLDTPDKGLFIGNMLWREMHDFSADCVLLVLASQHYSEDDYIHDYEKFVQMMSK